MKTINQYINESITSKEDFFEIVIPQFNDEGDKIIMKNGNIQFIKLDDNGKDLVISELDKERGYREYYALKKNKKRK